MSKFSEYINKVKGINEVNLDLGEYGTLDVTLQYQFNLYNDKNKDELNKSLRVVGSTPSEIIDQIKDEFGPEITPSIEDKIRQDIAYQLQDLAQKVMTQRAYMKGPKNIAFPMY